MRHGCCGKAMFKASKRILHKPHRATRRTPHSSPWTFIDIRRGASCRYIEKQFDRPSTLVESADGQCRQTRVIGQKHQRFVGLGVCETDAAQMFWVMLPTVETIQC